MTLQELADLQRRLNREEDWEGKEVDMERLAREIAKLTDSQYSEFLGYLNQSTMMVPAMKKAEAQAYVNALDAKNKKIREKFIKENFII